MLFLSYTFAFPVVVLDAKVHRKKNEAKQERKKGEEKKKKREAERKRRGRDAIEIIYPSSVLRVIASAKRTHTHTRAPIQAHMQGRLHLAC